MKLFAYITALAIAAAGLASSGTAATITTTSSDLILGFQVSSGIGSASNVEVDLGSFATYQNLFNAASSTPTVVANLGADLTATYGTGAGNAVNWNARTDLTWSFAGKAGTTTVSNYVSFVETTAGTQSTAPTTSSFSFGNLGTAAGNIGLAVQGMNGATSTANSNTTAIITASSPVSYSTAYGSDGLAYGFYSKTDVTNGTVVSGSNYVVSDLYKLTSNTSGTTKTVTYVGSFALNSLGVLSYSYNPAVFATVVAKTDQTITFAALADKTFGDAAFALGATASSGLTPTFFVLSGPATLSGSTLTLTGAGSITIRASQAGNNTYNAAPNVDRSFTVAQAAQSITFAALPDKTFGDAAFDLSATASSGLTPTFSIVSGPAMLTGNTLTITGVGTVTIRASQTGNTNYTTATVVDRSFTVAQATQTITFATLADKTFGDAAFTLSATASSGLTPTFSVLSGPATLAGNTLTLTGAGTVTVRASQAANANYTAATDVDRSFTVAQSAQTITFAALPGKTFGDAAFDLTATASSGLTPAFSILSGPATLSGNTLTLTGAGTVTVRASQAGNTNFAAASVVDRAFTVAQASQTITFAALSGKTFGDAAFDLTATASSGLTPTFSILSGPATLSGSTLTITGAGTVTVRASQSGNSNYTAATDIDRAFTVAQAAQTITFAALPDKTFGDADFDLSATASSGLTPTFSILSGPATLSGNTLTLTGAGIVTVRASQSGNSNYAAASNVDRSFNVAATGGAAQSITFAALPDKTFGDPAFTLSATASSALTVSFSVLSGPATLSGNTLTITGAGTVTVRASQGGDNSYAAATDVDRSFNVAKAAQTITFAALSGKTFGDAAFDLSATASSGLTPTFSVLSGPATLSGNTLTITGAGTVTVRSSQSGNSNYAAATDVDRAFTVAQASQTITFAALSGKTFGDAAFDLTATASSGLTPIFSVFSGPATLSGNTLTLTGPGTVTIRASQAGNANYAAATDVDRSFNVAKTAQTITFAALPDKTFGDTAFDLSATTSSTLTVSFSIVSGPATLSGNTLTITGAGTVTVRASQSGNATYAAAPDVDRAFSVGKASQTITFAALPDKALGDAAFDVSASASSTLTVSFTIVSGPATLSGNTLTLTGAGTVTVRASQAGNANYSAAPDVDRSFSVGKTSQTITFAALPDKTYGNAAFALGATASSGLTPTFAVVSGPATLAGSTLTLTGIGTVTVRASQAGNANYAAAPDVDRSFAVAITAPGNPGNQQQKAGRLISLSGKAPGTPGDVSFYATGLPAGLTIDPATGLISGTITAAPGNYTVTLWTQIGSTQSTPITFTWTVDPFPAALTGKFEGLFVAPSGAEVPVAKLAITVTNTGSFTGRLTQGNPGTTSLDGQFTLDDSETFATLSTLTGDSYTLNALTVSTTTGANLTALLSKGTPTTIGKLTDGVKLTAYTTGSPAPWATAYTAAFSPSANLDISSTTRAAPVGSGYATGAVSADGTLTLTGKLADGTAFTGSFATTSDATYRLFVQPHGTAGNYFGGWIKLTRWSTAPSSRYRVAPEDGQDFYWNKPAKTDDLNYRAGFGPLALRFQMATWITPTTSANNTLISLLGLSAKDAAKLSLQASGGSVSVAQQKALVAPVKLTTANALSIANAKQAALWPGLTLAGRGSPTGFVTGSIKVQDTKTISRSAIWEGVFLQLPADERGKTLAQGFFMMAPPARAANAALGCVVTLTAP